MLTLFALSIVLAVFVTYMMYKGLYYYKTMVLHENPVNQFRQNRMAFGDASMLLFLTTVILLSILFFFFLTKPYLKYFNELSNGIHHLANGNFTKKIHISSNDEFGNIASEINIASEKLKEAVEKGDFAENSKNQLIVNLAHDLRTPLTSVLGYLDLILKNEHLTKEQIKKFSTIAFTKSKRLESLVDELFEITRMNYGMLNLNKKGIDISELLIQIDEELYPLLEKHHLKARLNIESQLHINGDGELLARVFENLLTNAIRYGDNEKFIDINGYIDGGEVVVQIINYGDSIPEGDLPYLFDMLYTGDKSRAQQKGGTGLGLFIAKNIVKQHNGTISVQSNVTRTLFEVRLPKEK